MGITTRIDAGYMHSRMPGHKYPEVESGTHPLELIISTMTTDEALHYEATLAQERGTWVNGLNFANGGNPGGGYWNGAAAQEEDLCRCIPALFFSLQQSQKRGSYPFGPRAERTYRDGTPCPDAIPGRYTDVLLTS